MGRKEDYYFFLLCYSNEIRSRSVYEFLRVRRTQKMLLSSPVARVRAFIRLARFKHGTDAEPRRCRFVKFSRRATNPDVAMKDRVIRDIKPLAIKPDTGVTYGATKNSAKNLVTNKTFNMDIKTVNDILRTKKRPSAAKQVLVGNNDKPNVPSLKQRLADVRREVATGLAGLAPKD
jgi:hypothetical protein